MKKLILSLCLLALSLGAEAQLLYKVSGKGLTKPSYILGTQHLAPISFVDSIVGVKAALAEVEQVYGELDMAQMSDPANAAKMQKAMLLPEGQSLTTVLSANEMERLGAFLLKHLHIDLSNPAIKSAFEKLTPGALSTQLSVLLLLKKERGFNPSKPFDGYFQEQARLAGKPVGGLETLDTQIKVLFQKPMDRQVKSLMCLVDYPEVAEAMVDKLLKAFYTQNMEAIAQVINEKQGSGCDPTPEERNALFGDRNRAWVQQMPQIMQERSTFFAVGAGHLPSADGILALLREAGYTITPIK